MKKTLTLISALLLSVLVFAQGGVNFEELSFADALAKAKAEKKLVFMDCYTTWCGPCKHMTNNVFPQKEAGDYFNPRFVNVKYDMEKGEGIELKKQFAVRAFPTFLIIRPDGTVQHRIVGGGELQDFIGRVERGLNPKTTLSYLDARYEAGKMKKKELALYHEVLQDAYDEKKAEKIYNELKPQLTDKDKLKAEFWFVFEDRACVPGTADFNLLLANIPTFEKNIGKERLEGYLDYAYARALSAHILGRVKKDAPTLADLRKQIEGLDITQKAELLGLCDLAENVNAKNAAKVLELFEQQLADAEKPVWDYVSAFRILDKELTKADFARIAAGLEKKAAGATPATGKEYLDMLKDSYKKKAHVGVYFEELTFEQALAKAQKTGQQIFMDCYTTWCGPCKYMTTTIFPQEKMGDFLNNRYICVKYDMEKGEGPELLKRFDVAAFPTFLIINPDGTVRHKIVGGDEVDGFIERVKEADDDTKAIGALEAKYNAGNRDKQFVETYIKALLDTYSRETALKVVGDLFNSLSDEEKTSKEYWYILSNNGLVPADSPLCQYMLANREKLVQTVGTAEVDNRIYNVYAEKLYMILAGRNPQATAQSLDQMKKEAAALKLSNGKALAGSINIVKAHLSGNQNQLLATCEREVGNMTGEQFPLVLFYVIEPNKLTASQKARWTKLVQKVADRCEDANYAKRIEPFKEAFK